jgi:hypothetical protein
LFSQSIRIWTDDQWTFSRDEINVIGQLPFAAVPNTFLLAV